MSSFMRVMLVIIASLFGTAGALGQDQSKLISIPADNFVMSPGGVDLRTGRYASEETDLLIGDKERDPLSLTRIMPNYANEHANPFGNFSHNWDIWLVETRVNLSTGVETGTTGGYRMYLHLGGRTLTFEAGAHDIAFTGKSMGPPMYLNFTGKKDGNPVYTFKDSDGTLIQFRPMGTSPTASECTQGGTQIARRCVFAQEVVRTSGTRFTLEYAEGLNTSGNRARLRRVNSSRGYVLILDGNGNKVTKACVLNLTEVEVPSHSACPPNALASAEYEYHPVHGFLTSAKGPTGAVATFTYQNVSDTSRKMGFVKAGQITPWLENSISLQLDEEGGLQEIVTRQDFSDGQFYTYGYDRAPVTANRPNPAIVGGGYTDAAENSAGVRYEFPILPGTGPIRPCLPPPCQAENPDDFMNNVYQQTSGPTETIDALGRTTFYDYCDPLVSAGLPTGEPNRCVPIELQSFTDPSGIKTVLKYDGRGNITQATRTPRQIAGQPTPASIITLAEYQCTAAVCATKPTSITDGKGAKTLFSYSEEHGGLVKVTDPAVHRPDGSSVTPQRRYYYVQRHASLRNGGGHTPASHPVWLLSQESFCRTGNPGPGDVGCAIAGDEVLTSYDYGPSSGPNNLLLRGKAVTADGTILRTCYAYDALGRMTSETQPRSNLSTCS